MNNQASNLPFKLNGALGLNRIPLLEPIVERSLALHHLNRLYNDQPKTSSCMEFLEQTLKAFNVRYLTYSGELDNIPQQGPAIMVANHPYGAIEGVVLTYLLLQIRPDIKIMANQFLYRIPELRELFIGVDSFGSNQASKSNSGPLREAIRWVRKGGLLLVFPAGEVSYYRLDKGCVTDPEWSSSIARLIRMSGAAVIPSYIHGNNGVMFQLAGLVHPRLRTALLPRQLTNKYGHLMPIRIGEAISPQKLSSPGLTNEELSNQLRLRCYMLAEKLIPTGRRSGYIASNRTIPVASQVHTDTVLQQEVTRLSAEQRLVDGDEMQVYYAHADQIPNLMQEIGRLRELTFRATGEGTGRERDIDLYDSYYLHLFIWNKKESELVGAYRLGLVDQITRKYGIKGLYSFSLFKYRRSMIDRISPAIELGRSFIRKEYQRSFSPLLLLWRGIGAYVCRNPKYRILFGPVSISSEYKSLSQQMMVSFLMSNRSHTGLAQQIKPRRPFQSGKEAKLLDGISDFKDLDLVSDLISQLEPDGKGVPILLKQYLKMGGHILGFNVDKEFNNSLDGLVMVDLEQSPQKLLQRYMGKDGAARFLDSTPHTRTSIPITQLTG